MKTPVKMSILTAVFFVFVVMVISAMPCAAAEQTSPASVAGADYVWLVVCSGLVFLMVPGLAFFYGGMLRKQSMTSMVAQCLIALGVMSLIWITVGYSLAFGSMGGVIGNLDYIFLSGIEEASDYDVLLFVMFQGMFAAVAAAILIGACAERVRFTAITCFLAFWGLMVYVPMAHWVWGGGFEDLGLTVLDFAGGDVVHICSAVSGLAVVVFIGKRKEATRRSRAHNIPFAFLGAMLLWVGWFGFNGGSGLHADDQAIHAVFVTQVSAIAGMVSWAACQYALVGRIGVLGLISGAIAGLVAITPGAGYIGIPGSFVTGIIGGVLCFFAVRFLHRKDKFDDALDVFGIHGIGGIWGGISTGLFAESRLTGGCSGLFFGSADLFYGQIVAVAITVVFCFGVSYVIISVLSRFIQIRIPEEEESIGQDIVEHGEPSYF